MSGRKIVALVCLIAGLAGAVYGSGILSISNQKPRTPEDKLIAMWNADLAILEKTKSLPDAFFDIADVDYLPSGDVLKKLLLTRKPEIKTKADGKHSLQIFLDEMPNEKAVLVQYDVVDKASGNTIWELNRSIPFKISPNEKLQ